MFQIVSSIDFSPIFRRITELKKYKAIDDTIYRAAGKVNKMPVEFATGFIITGKINLFFNDKQDKLFNEI